MISTINPLNKAPISDMALDAVADMDVSMFGSDDVLNMILQRAQILFDIPKGGALIRDHINGDSAALNEVARKDPDLFIRRTLGAIYQEYDALRPVLAATPPKRLADIGCGYGFFDVFAAKEFGCDIVLIDIEQSEELHFGYRKKGAAYSNLSIARRFALANGVPQTGITVLNPEKEDLGDLEPVDLAVSFMSCGFHYPVNTYLDFFCDGVTEAGSVILDLRRARAEEQIAVLDGLGDVTTLTETDALTCVRVEKRAT